MPDYSLRFNDSDWTVLQRCGPRRCVNTDMALTKPTYNGGRHGYTTTYHKPQTIVIRRRPGTRCRPAL